MKTSTGNRFDELFKERFRDFEENPPASVLEKIKNTTSGISTSAPFWKKGGFFVTVGIIAVVGTTMLLIHSFSSSNNTKTFNNQILTNNTIAPINKEQITPQTNHTINVSSEKQIVENIQNNKSIIQNITTSDNITEINKTEQPPINIQNNTTLKSIPENTNINYIINVKVQAATCRKANGNITLSSNYNNVLFYWTDFTNEEPNSYKDKLLAGNYHIKSVSDQGIEQNLIVTVPDSGIIRARFTHYEMTQAIGVPVYFSNKSTIDGADAENIDNTAFKWYFGDGKISTEINPEHMYNSVGPYTVSLVAYSPQGCKDSSSTIPLYIAGSDIETSNIFTPNGDGKNDIFIPQVQALQSYSFIVFNRNGQTLFKTTDPSQGWDGKINHGSVFATPGTYLFVIKGIGIDEKVIEIKGSVNLEP